MDVAVPVAMAESKVKGLNDRARLKEPVPPRAVEPEPVVLLPLPKVMAFETRAAVAMEPAGTEIVPVAVIEPTVRLPIVVLEKLVSVVDPE